jgi:hypothetical protein
MFAILLILRLVLPVLTIFSGTFLLHPDVRALALMLVLLKTAPDSHSMLKFFCYAPQ